MTAYEIPFAAEPQTFVISLGGVVYRLTTTWCDAAPNWVLNVEHPDDGPLIMGIPIVPGVDLLGQYEYLGIKGKIFVQSAATPTRTPGYDDLGAASLVFFVTEQ
jgi:hypothetical protein